MEASGVLEELTAEGDFKELLAEWVKGDKERTQREVFRFRAAVFVAVVAAILAAAQMLGSNVIEDMMHSNAVASDLLTVAVPENELEARLAFWDLSPEERASLQQRVEQMKQLAVDFDPNIQGQAIESALLQEANRYHQERDAFLEKDRNFDYAQLLLELTIILGAVAILAVSRAVITVAAASGVLGVLILLNGITLWVHLPI